jgi:predicted alpha/beta hydrolase family esterase
MKEHIISTQDEYDRAIGHIALLRKRPFYDIECNKGTEIIEEVDSLVHQYLYHVRDKSVVYDGLSRFHFDRSQADEIMRYFQEHLPGDMFDIERGLNRLNVIPRGHDANQPGDEPRVIIKDAREKIMVCSDAEVRGNSFVEAFDHASITAENDAYIIAHDEVSAIAFHKSRVDSYDHSRVQAFNNALVTASGESRVEAYHKSCVKAGENAKVSAYHDAYVNSMQDTVITAYDRAIVDAWGNSRVAAFNESHIIARDKSVISAHDRSFIHASDMSKITARNQSCVAARKNASVTGSDDSLVLTRDNARSETSGNSSLIDGKDNNAANLRKNVLTVMRHPRSAKDPILAMRLLIQAIPEENREAINKKLLGMGCTDVTKSKIILNRLVKTREEDISYDR